MGWFWSSTPAVPAAVTSPADAVQASSPSSSPATPPPPPPSTTAPSPSSSSSPPPAADDDETTDPELRKFIDMFHAASTPDASAARTTTTTAPASASDDADADDTAPSRLAAWKAAWSSSNKTAAADTSADHPDYTPRERSLAEATLPESMSCRQAFDLAWACQSPAGQWRAVFRHGHVQGCSALWDDFWFCMRVQGFGKGPVQREAVRSHYRQRELARYYAPGTVSSEDVWPSRTVDEVLPPGAVFQQNFQVVVDGDGSGSSSGSGSGDTSGEPSHDAARRDADQILADAERRRNIRQSAGYK